MLTNLGTDHYFFGGGDGKFLKKLFAKTKKCKSIVCTHREEEKNSLQANEIMQHQLRFNNNEQSAHRHTQRLHPRRPGMGHVHMSQSTYGL